MSRTTRLICIVILLIVPSAAKADLFPLGATWSGTFSTYNSSGTLTNADSTPTCESFIGSSSTAVNTGTVTNISAGFYRYQITMSVGNGFAAGSSYSVLCTAVVGGTTQKVHHQDGVYLLSTPNTAGTLLADLTLWRGSTPNSLSSSRPDVSIGAVQNNAMTAAGFNADAFTAAKFAADVTTEFQTGLRTVLANTALSNFKFYLSRTSGGVTSDYTSGTSSNITCQVIKDGGSLVGCDSSTQSSITHISNGIYKITIAANDLNVSTTSWFRFYVPTDSAVNVTQQQIIVGH